jgi:hypothetical protein
MATPAKKLLTPKDNKMQISNQRDFKFYNFLAKIFLKEFETVELHALGEAISLSVRVAENMSRFGYATITKIEQLTFHPDEKEEHQQGGRRKIKLIINLKRTADFNEKTKNLQK